MVFWPPYIIFEYKCTLFFYCDIILVMTDAQKEILKWRRTKNALSAEETRSAMSPSDYVIELLELKEQFNIIESEEAWRLREKVNILNMLLKKCLPDMKAVEMAVKTDSISEIFKELSQKLPD